MITVEPACLGAPTRAALSLSHWQSRWPHQHIGQLRECRHKRAYRGGFGVSSQFSSPLDLVVVKSGIKREPGGPRRNIHPPTDVTRSGCLKWTCSTGSSSFTRRYVVHTSSLGCTRTQTRCELADRKGSTRRTRRQTGVTMVPAGREAADSWLDGWIYQFFRCELPRRMLHKTDEIRLVAFCKENNVRMEPIVMKAAKEWTI